MSQATRLLAYLRANPGATPMQMITELRVPKYTARISDLRAMGYDFDITTDDNNVTHYTVREKRPVLTGDQLGAWR